MNFDWKERYVAWAVLAGVFFVSAFSIVKSEANVTASVVYGTSALCITLMLFINEHLQQGFNKQGINIYAYFAGAVTGSAPVMVSAKLLDVNSALFVAFLGVGLFVFLQYQKFIAFFQRTTDEARYLVAVPMIVWVIWGVMYFKNGTFAIASDWPSMLYHLGILLFAGWGAIRLFVGTEDSRVSKVSMAMVAVIAIGILLSANLKGVGLNWVV